MHRTSSGRTRDKRPRRVVVAVTTAASWGRRIVRGTIDYADQRGPAWELLFQAGSTSDPRRLLEPANADGLIMHPPVGRWVDIARQLDKPVVLVGESAHLAADWPCVSEDNIAVGRLAYEHLSAKGFRRVAFWGFPGVPFSDKREDGLFAAAAGAGGEVVAQRGSRHAPHRTPPPADLGAWLAGLPRPAGVLFADCNLAVRGAWACRRLSPRVPEELALLSVDDDSLLCDITTPAISSIEQNCRRIGYLAARRIDRLLDGRDDGPHLTLVPPAGVVERRSTESLAIEDPLTAESVAFIRRHATEGIAPADVLEAVAVSRTNLEQRFRRDLGRTIFQEIRRVRVEHAMRLLRETDLKVRTIARRCGFRDATYFATALKRQIGASPSAYRTRFGPAVFA